MRISDWSSDVCSSDLAGNGDDQHAGRLDRFWFAEPVDRFDQDINRNREQHEGVERGCQDLEALVAKGALIVGGLRSDPNGHQRDGQRGDIGRSEEHTSELQSLMRISYAVFCLKKNKKN